MPLEPRKQVPSDAFPTYGFHGNLPLALRAQQGRILSRWGDAGWGRHVEDDKHAGYFRDDLVDDVVDSGWTMTVLAALLQQAGSGPVFPLALASTAVGD